VVQTIKDKDNEFDCFIRMKKGKMLMLKMLMLMMMLYGEFGVVTPAGVGLIRGV
jgi:hypothetical protein